MKCLKCGYENAGKVCPNCGEIYHYIKTKKLNENKLKENSILIFIGIIFVLLLSVGFVNLNNYSDKLYIEINGNKIPTITSLVGKKEVVNFIAKDNAQTISYNYDKFENVEIQDYIALLNKENFIMYEKETGLGLVKEKNGKVTEVNLNIENGNLKIYYGLKNKSIKDYVLIGEFEIGNDEVGYLKIPGEFVKKNHPNKIIYTSINESVTMESKSNISLIDFTEENIQLYQKNNGTVRENTIKIHGYLGYQLNVEFIEGYYLRNYIFKKDNKIISLTFETNNKYSDINSTIYSYVVVK